MVPWTSSRFHSSNKRKSEDSDIVPTPMVDPIANRLLKNDLQLDD